MRCRYCKNFKSVTLASLAYPKGKYKTDRECVFTGLVANRDDDIFTKVYEQEPKGTKKSKEPRKFTKVFCPGFELDATFYCEEGYTISVEGCLKRQESGEEQTCNRCKKKYEIREMKKISFLMKRKREKPKSIPKPIVR